jgi:hypothetical protein
MPADLHRILDVWRNHFLELVDVHRVNNVTQTAIHTAERLVPESSVYEFEVAIEKLKGHKSPSVDQILAELIKAGGRKIRSEINKLINSVWKKEELYMNYNIHIIYKLRQL